MITCGIPRTGSRVDGALQYGASSCLEYDPPLHQWRLMKSYTQYLTFNVSARMGFMNITDRCEAAVKEADVLEGLLLANAMHITASVFINDDESGLHQDYKKWLEALAPHAPTSQYQHNRTGEDNADAHMKRQIM